jgi:hypothetical protein
VPADVDLVADAHRIEIHDVMGDLVCVASSVSDLFDYTIDGSCSQDRFVWCKAR